MDRLLRLQDHLRVGPSSQHGTLHRQETSSVKSLPRFDSYVLGRFIDDLYEFKQSVYEEFRQHPELLPPVIEGMTKGAGLSSKMSPEVLCTASCLLISDPA